MSLIKVTNQQKPEQFSMSSTSVATLIENKNIVMFLTVKKDIEGFKLGNELELVIEDIIDNSVNLRLKVSKKCLLSDKNDGITVFKR